MIRVSPAIALDERDIELAFIRASGPGGQNVNKVATAVQLRFNIERSLPPAVRERLRAAAGRRVSGDGTLIITAQRFRTQEQNRRDALERLVAMVRAAAQAPRRRIPTAPSGAARRRRLDRKRRRGDIKRARSGKLDFT